MGTLSQIAEVLASVEELKELRPLVRLFIEELAQYGPDIREASYKLASAVVGIKIQMIKQYQEAGFSKEEAILLTCDSISAARQSLSNNNK